MCCLLSRVSLSFADPQSPVVNSVTGCQTNVFPQTRGCPTEGHTAGQPVLLLIQGSFFAPFPSVTVGGRPCLGLVNVPPSSTTTLSCELPSGTGFDQQIVVKQGLFY